MKGRAIFVLLVVVLFASLLVGTTVLADEETPTPSVCESPGWWLEYVTTTYTGTHTVLELVLKQEDADHGFSNAGWTGICILCEELVEIRYQTSEMDEPAVLFEEETECEDDSAKIKIERTFEPGDAPVRLWFEINFKSLVSDQAYTLKWAQSECGGSVNFFNCEAPPTAVTLATFDAYTAKPLSESWLKDVLLGVLLVEVLLCMAMVFIFLVGLLLLLKRYWKTITEC